MGWLPGVGIVPVEMESINSKEVLIWYHSVRGGSALYTCAPGGDCCVM